MLDCALGELPLKYLGIPISDHHLGMGAFEPIFQKMLKRLDPWKGKHLLQEGGKFSPTHVLVAFLFTTWVFTGVGYHKKRYPNRSNKKRKGQSKLTTITKARAPAHLTPGSQTKPRLARPPGSRTQAPPRPTPQGLGRKFRLARPRGSDADTASPDPLGLGRKFRLARPLQGSGAKRRSTRSGQDFRRTAPVPTT
jgi:hypothetical protein